MRAIATKDYIIPTKSNTYPKIHRSVNRPHRWNYERFHIIEICGILPNDSTFRGVKKVRRKSGRKAENRDASREERKNASERDIEAGKGGPTSFRVVIILLSYMMRLFPPYLMGSELQLRPLFLEFNYFLVTF